MSSSRKTTQINARFEEEERQEIEIIRNVVKETTGRKPTFKNIFQQGIRNYKDDPFIDLRIEEYKTQVLIEKLEEEKEETILKYDAEIKKNIKRLEEIKEQINGTYKGNLEELNQAIHKQNNKTDINQELENNKKELIGYIKETIKQKGHIEFNKEVEILIKTTMNGNKFKKYNVPYVEVEAAIKEYFNSSNEPIKKEVPGIKKNNETYLTLEQERPFKQATEFILKRYYKHKKKNNNLTLFEFWNKQNDNKLKPHDKLIDQLTTKYFKNLENEEKRRLSRLINKSIKNNELEQMYNNLKDIT